MDSQSLINAAFALVGILGGWVLNSLRDSIKALHEQDEHLVQKVQAIEVSVAGNYVKRDDMDKMSSAIFQKLDRIEQKLDKKVDR